MQTNPIERLLYSQGGQCFFCRKPLPKFEASVEHLIAVTHGGKDNDENCVACCKTLNTLFGRMSLKEKLQVVLNQRGDFKCPAGTPMAAASKPSPGKSAIAAARARADKFALVVADLQKRGNARPSTLEKLLNTIRCYLVQLGEPGSEAESLLQDLASKAYVTVSEEKIAYTLPPKGI